MRTRISRILIFALTAFLPWACEREFDPKLSDSDNQLLLEGIVAGDGGIRLALSRVTPIGASYLVRADGFMVEEISVTADGRSAKVQQQDAQHWFIAGDNAPGSSLELSVRAYDAGALRARTTVPRKPVIGGAEVSLVESQPDEAALVRITLSLGEEIQPEDRFGLLVDREMTTVVVTPQGEEYTYRDTLNLGQTLAAEDVPLERLMQGKARMSITFPPGGENSGQMLILHGADLQDGKLNALYATKADHQRELLPGYSSTTRYRFRCRLFRLSPELYSYLAAQYNKANAGTSRYGLAPANYNYSNVQGGYGVFGAISPCAETPWLENALVE